MVLAILYENFYHPVTILSALPFAGFGALLFSQTLTLYVKPVFYLHMESFQDYLRRRREAREAPAA
jgi:multidrug efflux pump subunit AcrB